MRNVIFAIVVLCVCSCDEEVGKPIAMDRWKSAVGNKIEPIEGIISVDSSVVLSFDGKHKEFVSFDLNGYFKSSKGSSAGLFFHSDDSGKGYEVLFQGGEMDGSRKSGSLVDVRNIYKGMAYDDEWASFEICVTGKLIYVKINGIMVVRYVEPSVPFRIEKYKDRLLSSGNFVLKGYNGITEFRDLRVIIQGEDSVERVAIDETKDDIIRLQQKGFPLIDYHVHLKGWSKEQAHKHSMEVGINYGIAPNCGIGFPITDDQQVRTYRDTTANMPFFFGMQGEGREWVTTFSEDARDMFDYVFTDAMTYRDHRNRRTRLWIDEEVYIDMPQERYMDLIVDKIVSVLSSEPIDIYVNPTFLPTLMSPNYDKLWTTERMNRVINVLKERNIALEINARYRIPNIAFINMAKQAGVKMAFGTNNSSPEDIGKLEYCVEVIDKCGLTEADMWYPMMKNNQ